VHGVSVSIGQRVSINRVLRILQGLGQVLDPNALLAVQANLSDFVDGSQTVTVQVEEVLTVLGSLIPRD
jgi:hypothetical protein